MNKVAKLPAGIDKAWVDLQSCSRKKASGLCVHGKTLLLYLQHLPADNTVDDSIFLKLNEWQVKADFGPQINN